MEKNYYDEIIEKVEKLLENNDLQSAYEIINKELSLPYVPGDYIKPFNELKIKILNLIQDKNTKNNFFLETENILKVILNNDKNLISYALSEIEKRNLVDFKKELQNIFLSNEVIMQIKGIIYETLVKQKFDHDFIINDIKLNPLKNGSISYKESYIKLTEEINQKSQKDISILNTAQYIFNTYLILNFDKYLIDKLDIDIIDEIMDVSLVLLNQKNPNNLTSKAIEIMQILS